VKEVVTSAIAEVLAAHPELTGTDREILVKLVVTRGKEGDLHEDLTLGKYTGFLHIYESAPHASERSQGIGLVTLNRGYSSTDPQTSPWLLIGAKSLAYAVNRAAVREAKKRGADEALFVTSDGIVLEGTTCNLIAKYGDTFITPEPTVGLLHGTTQRRAFDYLQSRGFQCAYGNITTEHLKTADAMWMLSSGRLAAPVNKLDGVPVNVDEALSAGMNEYLINTP
jgi:4-amino-4-deoxychorismate lyase